MKVDNLRGVFIFFRDFLLKIFRKLEIHVHDKFSAFAGRGDDFDISAHKVDDTFSNRHAKPRALNFADSRSAFAFKSLEDFGGKFGRHANAAVFDVQFIIRRAVVTFADLLKRHGNFPAFGRELVSIAKEVKQNPVKAVFIEDREFIFDAGAVDAERNIFVLHLRREHIVHFVHSLNEVIGHKFEFHFAAFNAAHFQHVINQREQMLAGGVDFLQEIVSPIGDIVGARIIFIKRATFASLVQFLSEIEITDNRVHGRSNIVAHVGKES